MLSTVSLPATYAYTFLDEGTANGITTGGTSADDDVVYVDYQGVNVFGGTGEMYVRGVDDIWATPRTTPFLINSNTITGNLITLTAETAQHLPLNAQAGDLLHLTMTGNLGIIRPPAVTGAGWVGSFFTDLREMGNPLNPFYGLPWLDHTSVYDVGTGTAGVDFSGLINIYQFTDFNDVAVYAGDDFTDILVTGVSGAGEAGGIYPFVARIRYSNGSVDHAKVLVSSTTLPLPGPTHTYDGFTPRRSPGVAVNDEGTVLTTLPTPVIEGWGSYRPVAFHAEFPEGTGDVPTQISETHLWSKGMTTNSRGDFIISDVPAESGRTSFEFAVIGRDLANVFLIPFSNYGAMRVHNGLGLTGQTVGFDVAVKNSNDATVFISTNLEGDNHDLISHPYTRVIQASYFIPDLVANSTITVTAGNGGMPITNMDDVLVDFSVRNTGTGLATNVNVDLKLDGVTVHSEVIPYFSAGTVQMFTDVNLGRRSPGQHTLSVVVDAPGWAELDESNNLSNTAFTVESGSLPDLTPAAPGGWDAPIVVSTVTGTNTDATVITENDTVFVDWAVNNQGDAGTSVRYHSKLSRDGTLLNTWYTDPQFGGVGAFTWVQDYNIGTFSPGTYTLTIEVDYLNEIAESDESNNSFSKQFVVVNSATLPDLAPAAPTGWDAPIVVSTVTGTNADAAVITDVDTVYVDWAVLNQGNAATSVRYHSRLSRDGAPVNTWYTDPVYGGVGAFAWVQDYNLGMFSPGTYTLTIEADYLGEIAESDESNNSFSRQFTVLATPPGLVSLSPADNAADIDARTDLVINFSEPIRKGMGNIVFKRSSDDSTFKTIDVVSGEVTVAGSTATINPSWTFVEGAAYYVQIAAGTFEDLAGNPFAGIVDATTWNFVTADPSGEIRGVKWDDRNGNGVMDAGEPGVQGWTIYLDLDQSGDLTAGDIATTTGADGSYSFPALPAATYTVGEHRQTGWEQTYPALGPFQYDNGPLINSPGTGVGGADESVLQSAALGMTALGLAHHKSQDWRVADDFTVTDPAGAFVDTITLYAYQTGSATASTVTEVNFRIWDGPPNDPSSTVVFGDTTTNRLVSTVWSSIYRVDESTTGTATNRPIMANTVSAGVNLPPGTYWLDWQSDGSLSSGPWAPPITINSQATTGNALQFSSSGVWQNALDGGTATQQGFPFLMGGARGGGTHTLELGVGEIAADRNFGNRSLFDFGDAPDPTYPTLLASNGARHVISGPWLGNAFDAPDSESDGQPTAVADGDDLIDAGDDEDGVSFPVLRPGMTETIILEVGGAGGFVDAWIDFDGSGTWDPAEQIHSAFLPVGTNAISVSVLLDATVGQTFARFRISTAGGLTPLGPAADGEVEDHSLTIENDLYFLGTGGDDIIAVRAGTIGVSLHEVDINGTVTTYDPAVYDAVHIDGLGGSDTLTIDGTSGNETATTGGGSVDVMAATYEIHASNVEDITLNSGGGNDDQIAMIGSASSNRLYSYADFSQLSDSSRTYFYRANDFDSVDVDVPVGGRNYAFLYDSPENEVLSVTPNRVDLNREDGAATRAATGFERVYVYATQGGTDTAAMAGSDSTQNRLYNYADYAILTEARRSFYFYARGFDALTVDSPGSTLSCAYLYDSSGDDALTASPEFATIDRAAPWSDVTASGFERVYGYSTRGGDDSAMLNGTATGGNDYRGYPTYSILTDRNRSFHHYVRGFKTVTALGSQTDMSGDRAYIHDSRESDTFFGRGDSAILKDSAGVGYQMEAMYFDLVYARSSDDSAVDDTVDVDDSLVYRLIQTGTW